MAIQSSRKAEGCRSAAHARTRYKSHGILPHELGGGPNGTPVTTEDGKDGSISSADIEALVDALVG